MNSATTPVPKIVLKSTTKQTLNDRFSKIIKNRPQVTAQQRTETMFQQQQVSAANRRLALQMENRMAVQTAAIPKQSLKQRLGQPNIQGRLGTPLGQRGQGRLRGVRGGRVRGTVFTRGGRGIARGPGLRVNTGARGRGRGGMRGGLRGGLQGGLRGGQRGRGVMRGQGVGRGQGFQRGARGAIRGFRGRGGRGGQQQMTGFKVRGARGQMRGRGRGRGGRGGRGRGRGAAAQVQVNKEDLDNQLDAYMSNTKSGLDAELDAYMAEADME